MGEGARAVARKAVVVVGTWLVLLGVVVAIGWLITDPGRRDVNGFDNPISRWFADGRDATLSPIADLGTLLGETVVGVSVAAVVCAGFAIWQRSWRPVLLVVLVEAGIGGFYAIATAADPRQRPPVRILDPGLVPDASYPSGHVATATAYALCIVLLARAYAPRAWPWIGGVLLVPLLTLVSRLYQGAHHLTDVLTSLGYATIWTLVVASVVLPAAPRGARIPLPHDRRVQHLSDHR